MYFGNYIYHENAAIKNSFNLLLQMESNVAVEKKYEQAGTIYQV